MSNYLKKILFTLLIIMMPHMNTVSKAMDNEEHNRSTNTCRMRVVKDDQNQDSSFVKQSISFKAVSLEDTQNSWTSYLYSPVKSVLHGAYEIVDFAIQRPKLAMFIGLSYAIPAVAAICTCWCDIDRNRKRKIGGVLNADLCKQLCAQQGLTFLECYQPGEF